MESGDDEALISKENEDPKEDDAKTNVKNVKKKDEPAVDEAPGPPKKSAPSKRCLIAAVTVLGIVAIVAVICAYTLEPRDDDGNVDGAGDSRLKIDELARRLVVSHNGAIVLRGRIGRDLRTNDPIVDDASDRRNATWTGEANLVVDRVNMSDARAACFRVHWTATTRETTSLADSYDLSEANWYGGAETHKPAWPLETNASRPAGAFTSGDLYSNPSAYGSVLQPIWLSSVGVVIAVNRTVPLFVGFDGGSMRLEARLDPLAYPNYEGILELSYMLCVHDDLRALYDLVVETFFERPTGTPDQSLFERPIWSTWAEYKSNVNETNVLQFADDIIRYNFSFSNIEIDDGYSSHYGDFDFDSAKFPNASRMIETLHSKGFNVTTWVHPFANVDSQAFKEGLESQYWVKGSRETVGLVSWWNSQSSAAAVLDVTNPEAAAWFIERLEKMRSHYGVDSFKFDGAEVSFLPDVFSFDQMVGNPGEYSAIYADVAARFAPLAEVRVGYFTQHLPLLVRVMDKDSRWDLDNGLHALVVSVLTLSVMGYPFVLPDMIGGNAYDPDDFRKTVCPSGYDELFVRWAQATALMPAMQFSLAPWNSRCLDSSVLDPVRKAVQLHERFGSYIVHLAKESALTGYPIVRPLWWIAPTDPQAQLVNDQFLLGDDVLVAPVIRPKETIRTLYLPAGTWIDGNDGTTPFEGQKEIHYKAPTELLPFFVRKDSKAASLVT